MSRRKRRGDRGPNDFPPWNEMAARCLQHRDRLDAKDREFIDGSRKWPGCGPSYRQWEWLVDIYLQIAPPELPSDEEFVAYVRKKLGV